MSRPAVARLACAAAAALPLIACGLLELQPARVTEPRPLTASQTVSHVSQRGFGRDARFARCSEPTCPAITKKVLAAASEPDLAAAQAASQPAVAASSFVTATDRDVDPDRPHSAETATPAAKAGPLRLTLLFGTNAARLTAEHKARLNEAFHQLQSSDRIVIAGRTDDVGSETVNQALALARGLAVRDHLLDLDPDLPARIAIDARGRCCYAAANDSMAGRAMNRRVEIAYVQSDRRAP